ncbi:ABC transporter ATP-binding protein [Olsenella profusa]|uniref:ABC transporter ATP-binding protein n=1 Tax=Olsenella profusa TaxID=138595 RepID=A0ABS2EZJ1_9ACTN|nr:ABC transporter ATP-binding protein [Olsenella profusa]MBM6774015.1 ABC transporter ATP-binding protein [Olsenella profusa]
MADRVKVFLRRNAFHRTGLRLLALVRKVDPLLAPLVFLDAALKVAALYAGLALTSGLVDSLVAADLRRSAVMAAGVVLVAFAQGCAHAALDRRVRVGVERCYLASYVMVRDYALSLDFQTMEDPELAERIAYIERTASMHGHLGSIPIFYRDMVSALLNIVTCVALVAGLCLAPPEATGALGVLASPGGSAVLLAVALVWAVRTNGLVGRARDRLASYVATEHTSVENRLSYLLGLSLEDVRAAKVTRIYDMGSMLMRNIEANQRASADFFDDWIAREGAIDTATSGVNALFVVASYVLVAAKVLAGAVTVGSFTTYAGALAQFGGAYAALVTANGQLREACAYLADLLEFLDMDDPRPHGSIPVEKRDDGQFEIAFEHVSFRYPGTDQWALRDVSFRLDTLGKLAVVGPNGAGKTTFIKLLCRLYDPTEGRITLNGVDIRKYDEEEYRDLFGVVFQDFKLFAFPVWENLAAGYARDDARMWEALRQAGADGLVRSWPDGLETRLYKDLGDGVMVSGGEAQKLALARALYKDAPVVILDEPTAALDPISEAEVYAGFDRMVTGRTAVYISHRMSSCRFCDKIAVFDAGRVVEVGTHEELLAVGRLYKRMWEAQASYYVGTERGGGAERD